MLVMLNILNMTNFIFLKNLAQVRTGVYSLFFIENLFTLFFRTILFNDNYNSHRALPIF